MLVAVRTRTTTTLATTATTTPPTTNKWFLQVASHRHNCDLSGWRGWPRVPVFCFVLLLILPVTQYAAAENRVIRGLDDAKMRQQTTNYDRRIDLFDQVDEDDDDDVYGVTDVAEYENKRQLSIPASDVPLPVQYDNHFLSRLRTADSALYDWQLSCTDTAEVVNQLITWPRVYVEYLADGPLPVDLFPVGLYVEARDSTTFCLERRFHWTGSSYWPTHAQNHSEEHHRASRACQPEVKKLVVAINVTHAAYLAVQGSVESVVNALKCIRLERLPVYVLSVDCHDVTSGTAKMTRLKLSHAESDRQRCVDEVTRRGWYLHAETSRDFVFLRNRDS